MKKIIIVHNYEKKSYNGMSYELANELAKSNHVLFISHSKVDEFYIQNESGYLKVENWPSNNPKTLQSIIWIIKRILSFKPTVVLGHFTGGILVSFLAKILRPIKVKNYYYYHTNFLQMYDENQLKTFKNKLLRVRYFLFFKLFCDVIICPSNYSKNDLKYYYWINKSIVIHNGLFDFNTNERNIPMDKIKLGFLGRFETKKGVYLLINAFKKYIKKFPNTKLELTIAGYGNTENLKKVEELIKDSPIQFIGPLAYNEVLHFFSRLTYTVVPSKVDNLPTTGIESLMFGVPIAICKNNGLAECIDDFENSFLLNFDEESFINWFVFIENYKEYSMLSKKSRTLFLEKFSIEKNVKQVSELILN